MEINLTEIIVEAQKSLIHTPYDLAHDVTHHYRVYEMVLEINHVEKLNLDVGVLAASAWLHDISDRKGNDTSKINQILQKNIQKVEVKNLICTAIKEHCFGKYQTNQYSKVLYDADKLEHVNKYRLLWFLQIYQDKHLSSEDFTNYINEWNARINSIYETLHFSISKKIFKELLPEAIAIMRLAQNQGETNKK